ncbi:MAG: hypothetical protein LBM77_00165 [Spirochaetaceae bacterium]|nr:hypothetical protein [Spirochaetaceae bacterium]
MLIFLWNYTPQGKARQGKARQGKARQGKARQGKALFNGLSFVMTK